MRSDITISAHPLLAAESRTLLQIERERASIVDEHIRSGLPVSTVEEQQWIR